MPNDRLNNELEAKVTAKYLAGENLTPDEFDTLRKIQSEKLVGAGKYSNTLFGPEADSLSELSKLEHQRSLRKQEDKIRAYSKGIDGAYQGNKESENRGSFGTEAGLGRFDLVGKARNREFIERVRNVSYNAFQDTQRSQEQALARRNVDIGAGHDAVNAEELGFLDTPVQMGDRTANVVGAFVGDAANNVDAGVQKAGEKLLGSGSLLDRSVDLVGKSLNVEPTTSTDLIGPIASDIGSILSASPWLRKRSDKKPQNRDEQPAKLNDTNFLVKGLLDVYNSRSRKLITEYAEIMNEWYHDPRTLCCFIKNVAALSKLVGKATTKEQYFNGEVKWQFGTKTREWFDKQIALLKMIRAFINKGISSEILLRLDIGLILSQASVAAIVAFLMAMHEGLKDSTYSLLVDMLENSIQDEWRQCVPFDRFIQLIVDFIFGDGGIFLEINKYIQDFINRISKNASFGHTTRLRRQMLDLTALDKLIDILTKLRDAVLSQELCIEADFTNNQNEKVQTQYERDNEFNVKLSEIGRIAGKTQPPPDGAPASDPDARGKAKSAGSASGANRVVFPTDGEVFNFIVNRLGESEDFANQVIATARRSSDLGSRAAGASDTQGASEAGGGGSVKELENAIGDCARTLNPDRVLELARLMSDWDLGL